MKVGNSRLDKFYLKLDKLLMHSKYEVFNELNFKNPNNSKKVLVDSKEEEIKSIWNQKCKLMPPKRNGPNHLDSTIISVKEKVLRLKRIEGYS